MPKFVQYLNYTWGAPPTLGALEATRLTQQVNKTLETLQKKNAKIIDVRPSYLIEQGGVVTMIIYEAESPLTL